MTTFGSVCSGIEAASVAWKPLGWTPAFLSEIEPFPIAVLTARQGAHDLRRGRAPDCRVPLFGDFSTIRIRHLRRFGIDLPDVLAGGTPCQGFSIAGLRGSLSDDRSNLALAFVRLAHAIDNARKWGGRHGLVVVWENVPGVLSTADNAYGCLLAGFVGTDGPLMSPLKRGRWPDEGMVEGPRARAAWRVLDAQYFGLAQRRERVFLVVGFRDAIDPAEILFEPIGVPGNPSPRKKSRKDVAPTIAARTQGGGGLGTDFDCDGGLIAADVLEAVAYGGNRTSGPLEVSTALRAHHSVHIDFESETLVAHALRGEGFDASEDGTGRGIPLVAFDCKASGRNGFSAGDIAPTLRAMGHRSTHQNAGGQIAVAFDGIGSSSECYIAANAVRRLMPVECERLQGFDDGYTDVEYRNKPSAPDGPRYKSLGNSWATRVARWIGERTNAALKRSTQC